MSSVRIANPETILPEGLTVDQAAASANLPLDCVLRAIRKEELKARWAGAYIGRAGTEKGGRLIVLRDDLRAWLDAMPLAFLLHGGRAGPK